VLSIPQLSVFGFALWTLLVPMTVIGIYRWWRILRGVQPIHAFPAHANCLENLPVLAVLVWMLTRLELDTRLLDALAITVLVARVGQSSVHIGWTETQRTVSIRFTCFFVQFLCMIAIAAVAILRLVAE
jgi:hypothetical protein